MTAPDIAAARLWAAFLTGMALGLYYGFLRPCRPTVRDLLFLPAAAAGWLFIGFRICRGDLRLGYFAAALTGGFFWDATAGRALRPVFRAFWTAIGISGKKILGFFRQIMKKIFASGKKSGTIKCRKITEQEEPTMRKLKRMLKNVRLVYRRSSTLTKTVVLSAIVLSIAALLTLSLTTQAYEKQTQENRDQAAQLEQENATLDSKVENQGSAEGVEQYAKDELGLVDPDTVILVPEQ